MKSYARALAASTKCAGWLAVVAVALAGSHVAALAQSAATPGVTAGSESQPAAPASGPLTLSASLTGDTKPLRSGLVWRVFEDRGEDVPPEPVAKASTANPTFTLPPGQYIVHAAYGFASASMQVVVGPSPRSERLSISAGAIKLAGAIGEVPIPPERLTFSIFLPIGNDSEGRLIIGKVRAGEVIRLPEGSYHVVSTYGESNAIMRTDLKVEPGRLTEATLNHRAATVTLKLVATAGGEAFAGTAFSVLTPGGDVIREAIGAFPTVSLAEGDYVLIARQAGRVYTRDFKVESGLDRDIEAFVTPDKAEASPSAEPGAFVPLQRP